ncbi:FMN-dependent dehydrogenase family protein [Neofusicoccum parvum]|uniref:FMN-dependent dehydrogenase family protein n=1 Tax=Neofusicoccum parvum TaxID=310453 RepID=A0ACB5SK71_9PEZI|nr:FMN-dependent dehydrogenase family protein [Neofusicoccum parvum]
MYIDSATITRFPAHFFNDGAMDMITTSLHDNEAAFNRYKILPRVLVDVSSIDTSTTIFGQRVAFPLGFVPAANHKLAYPDGEAATACAAARTGICMGLSAYSTTGMEEVPTEAAGAAEALGGLKPPPLAIQLTMFRNRDVSAQMVKRAESAGYKAVFLTADCPVLGLRLNEHRNKFALPDGLTYPNLTDKVDQPFKLADGDPGMSYDSTVTWEDVIPWLRSQTKMEIWVKGVYTVDDVLLAIRHGVDGVIISNHGGRQLDGVPATLDALRVCAPAAVGRIQIGIDSGIRRGTDIFKALALGATHCFVGRVPIWGLAHDGEDGVELALRILMAEFRIAMALAGSHIVAPFCADLSKVLYYQNSQIPNGDVTEALRFWYLATLLHVLSSCTARIAIGLASISRKAFPSRRRLVTTNLSISTAVGILFFFLLLFQCRPISAFWSRNRADVPASCYTTSLTQPWYAFLTTSMAADAILASFAIASLIKRTTRWWVRGVTLIFNLIAFGAVLSSAMQIAHVPSLADHADLTWSAAPFAIFSLLGPSFAVLGANLTKIGPLVRELGLAVEGDDGRTAREIVLAERRRARRGSVPLVVLSGRAGEAAEDAALEAVVEEGVARLARAAAAGEGEGVVGLEAR